MVHVVSIVVVGTAFLYVSPSKIGMFAKLVQGSLLPNKSTTQTPVSHHPRLFKTLSDELWQLKQQTGR